MNDRMFVYAVAVESFAHWKDALMWCREHFGQEAMRHLAQSWQFDHAHSWSVVNKRFYFKCENDAMLFKLRWVG